MKNRENKIKEQIENALKNTGQCNLCGKIADLRPYGNNGEYICFGCGMKDEETTKKMAEKVLFGTNILSQ